MSAADFYCSFSLTVVYVLMNKKLMSFRPSSLLPFPSPINDSSNELIETLLRNRNLQVSNCQSAAEGRNIWIGWRAVRCAGKNAQVQGIHWRTKACLLLQNFIFLYLWHFTDVQWESLLKPISSLVSTNFMYRTISHNYLVCCLSWIR